jgi:hypothetical protein
MILTCEYAESKISCTQVKKVMKCIQSITGARGSVVVKALCYKPEGRGFDTR